MTAAILEAARRIADERLFPAAFETDRAARVPEEHLQALAEAGLYGLEADRTHAEVAERLASGCLTTAFVWVQHHGAVQALATTDNEALRNAYLPALVSGRTRAGLAIGGLRSDPPELRAEATEGGFLLEGLAPWVTGFGLVHVLHVVARLSETETVRLLVDAVPGETLRPTPLALVAVQASCTVRLECTRHFVPGDRTIAIRPFVAPPPQDGGAFVNGFLALGVIRRACTLIGPSALDAELVACRRALLDATATTLAEARAWAMELAHRATATAIVRSGSRSIALDHHAQRLAREALFLLTFGTRPAVRETLTRRLVRRA